MNSLVVFLSVLALAYAAPSGLITYSAPAVLAPAAVSHQSRVDIKSSPAVVATDVVVPAVRSVIAQPAVIAQTAYAAPIARYGIAPAAVSTQSRVDIKQSPAIVSTYAAAPVAYSSVVGALPIAKTVVPSIAVAPVSGFAYSGLPIAIKK